MCEADSPLAPYARCSRLSTSTRPASVASGDLPTGAVPGRELSGSLRSHDLGTTAASLRSANSPMQAEAEAHTLSNSVQL